MTRRARFADLSVGAKIAALAAVLLVISGALTVTATMKLIAVRGHIEQIRTQALAPISALDAASESLLKERIAVLSHAASLDAPTKAKQEQALQDARTATDAALSKFEAGASSQDRSSLADVHSLIDQYRTLIDTKYLPASKAGDLATVQDLRDKQASPQMAKITDAVAQLADKQNAFADHLVDDTHSQVSSAVVQMLSFLAVAVIAGAFLGVAVRRSVRKPLEKVQTVIAALAHGDLTQRCALSTKDEIGSMATRLDEALDTLNTALLRTADGVTTLTSGADRLTSTAADIAGSADEASDRATAAAAGANQVSQSVESLAAGAEQMTASIREIATNASAASEVATNAVGAVEGANKTVSRLADSSQKIGEVVKLITTIAEQTNLLALNATIEAARAGEAGKGFAVVAGEVKELAQQTARATGDITAQVQAIQDDSAHVAQAIGSVIEVIAQIENYQMTIASAVEEQTATTQEMSRAAAQSAEGTTQIAAAIDGVASAATATSAGVGHTKDVALELGDVSAEFVALVGQFTLQR